MIKRPSTDPRFESIREHEEPKMTEHGENNSWSDYYQNEKKKNSVEFG